MTVDCHFCWGLVIMILTRILLYASLLCYPLLSLAQTPPLSEILTQSSSFTQDTILFLPTGKAPASISELRLHFLSSEDCYSGYLQGYRTDGQNVAFPLIQNQSFGLSSEGIYQVVQSVLDREGISTVRSILIRMADSKHGQGYEQFARFTGSCQDQDINCCMPIRCSVNAGRCIATYDKGMQPIRWL